MKRSSHFISSGVNNLAHPLIRSVQCFAGLEMGLAVWEADDELERTRKVYGDFLLSRHFIVIRK